MRKQGTVTIDDRKLIVKELTARHIIDLTTEGGLLGDQAEEGKENTLSLVAIAEHAKRFLPNFLELESAQEGEKITVDYLLGLAPSELKAVYEKFEEVNAVFFEVARKVGLGQLLDKLKQQAQAEFLRLLADL